MGAALAAALVALLVVAAAPAGSASSAWWRPVPADRFQIVLSESPSAAQLRGPFSVMELDGTSTRATTVASLHDLGKRAMCYVDVGTWERWRPDAGRFPKSVLGKPDVGWPGERWLDVRRTDVVVPLMVARLRSCAKKGFDAVDPDNVDGADHATGFALTTAEQHVYDRAIASAAHALGLAVALKGYAASARDLESSFDLVVVEQCAHFAECGRFSTFSGASKPVFDVEYSRSMSFCGALPAGVVGIDKHRSLDAWVRRCP